MKVLVTGGAGFIGAHVAAECLRRGHEVFVLDDLSGGHLRNVPRGANIFTGSITDDEVVEALFAAHKFDYVFHLAAYAAEGLSHFIRRFNYENNVIGSATLINAAVRHDVKCFVFTSSIAVYGRGLAHRETQTPSPIDPYGIAKYAVELDLNAAREMFGLNYVIFRPHNVYGPLQNLNDPYRNVIGIFMRQALKHEPMTIFGDGLQTRAFTYIDDIVPAMVQSVEWSQCYGQTFNIGSDTPHTVNNLAEHVSQAMGVTHTVTHLPARKEASDCYANHDKFRAHFGRLRETPIYEGLERMAAWAKEQDLEPSRSFNHIEVTKNLPPSWSQNESKSKSQ